jgi:hypothetical protein
VQNSKYIHLIKGKRLLLFPKKDVSHSTCYPTKKHATAYSEYLKLIPILGSHKARKSKLVVEQTKETSQEYQYSDQSNDAKELSHKAHAAALSENET